MTSAETASKELVSFIQEAHAMEKGILKMLDTMISTTDDEQIVQALERHKGETETHADRLADRLEALGSSPSAVKEATGLVGVLTKGLADHVRGDKPIRNARDGYATEHMEIAVYEILERLATRAGDTETAEVARLNREDEERMAKTIASDWDRVVALTLDDKLPTG